MKVSQVSNIASELLDRWSKERRFEVVWEKMREIRPFLLLKKCVLESGFESGEALEGVYTGLERGDFFTALIRYSHLKL